MAFASEAAVARISSVSLGWGFPSHSTSMSARKPSGTATVRNASYRACSTVSASISNASLATSMASSWAINVDHDEEFKAVNGEDVKHGSAHVR